jgi:hypothetical protein
MRSTVHYLAGTHPISWFDIQIGFKVVLLQAVVFNIIDVIPLCLSIWNCLGSLKVPVRLACLWSLAYLLSIRYSGLVNHGRLFLLYSFRWYILLYWWPLFHCLKYIQLCSTEFCTAWVRAGFVNYKGSLDSQPQVIKFTSCLAIVGGSLGVLRLLPPRKLVATI